MVEVKMNQKNDYSHYYNDLEVFSEHLSEKIGVDSLFKSRIEALRMLKEKPMFEVAEKGFFMNAPDKISSSYPDIPSFHNYKDLENAIKQGSHFINE